MKTIVRKHIARNFEIYGGATVGWGRSDVVVVAVFFLQYVVSIYTSCVITAVLKTDA